MTVNTALADGAAGADKLHEMFLNTVCSSVISISGTLLLIAVCCLGVYAGMYVIARRRGIKNDT